MYRVRCHLTELIDKYLVFTRGRKEEGERGGRQYVTLKPQDSQEIPKNEK